MIVKLRVDRLARPMAATKKVEQAFAFNSEMAVALRFERCPISWPSKFCMAGIYAARRLDPPASPLRRILRTTAAAVLRSATM